ncbi:MAG: hypothetical protein ABI685_06080 [Ferruginibacter sp.]
MKPILYLLVIVCCPLGAFCQDITGLWQGTMYNDSTHQSLEYELVISKVKGRLTGFSQTSYVVNDKKYFGIKKIDVRVAKDGKIVMQDAKMIANNYPGTPNKNVIQLNVLSLASSGEETFLDGIFVTNRSKDFQAFTGRLSIKKLNPSLSKSDLLDYLQKNDTDNSFTAVK